MWLASTRNEKWKDDPTVSQWMGFERNRDLSPVSDDGGCPPQRGFRCVGIDEHTNGLEVPRFFFPSAGRDGPAVVGGYRLSRTYERCENFSFALSGLAYSLPVGPTPYGVGCILAPLRGYGLMI